MPSYVKFNTAIKLISVYKEKSACQILYDLLKVRDPIENISHKKLPSFDDHKKFYWSGPYDDWFLIEEGGVFIGSIYLTGASEIGIHLFPTYRGKGYEPTAIQLLMLTKKRRRYLINVNRNNASLINIAEGLGFNHVQNTYEFTDP